MKKTILTAVVLASLLVVLSGCDLFFVDEEIQEIGKSGDYRDCASLDTSEDKTRIQDCYAYVGKKQNEPDACRAMDKKASGRATCFEDVAIDTHNEKLCEEVEAQVNQRNCYVEIGVYKDNPHLCMNLEGVSGHLCYKEYAQKAGEMEICDSIPNTDGIKDDCFLQFVSEAKDETFCSNFEGQDAIDDCYLSVAPKIEGNLLCAKINDEYKRNQCHIKMAVQLESIDECNRMDAHAETSEWKTCATQVGIAKLDLQYCGMIRDDDILKESCRKQVYNAQVQAGVAKEE